MPYIAPDEKAKKRRSPAQPHDRVDPGTFNSIRDQLEDVINRLWGRDGSVGLITTIEILKERMVTKSDLQAVMTAIRLDLRDFLKTEVTLAILEHTHDRDGNTEPKISLVELAKQSGIDLPALLEERSKKAEAQTLSQKTLGWISQLNRILQSWPIIYPIIILVMLIFGYGLPEILDFFKSLAGQP